MIRSDKLSSELGISYNSLFEKNNEYHAVKNMATPQTVRLHEVFAPVEIDFLACMALEYLKENSIDSVGQMMDHEHILKEMTY